ncbi:DUF4189 domain-containing protein [Stenotrophomonas lactitubi]|uniref:DUF4189 domain-containing protein n=1 Tax=Stenotrophomonas lactitubi TaxID=2045214 RepID=UPI003CCDCD15
MSRPHSGPLPWSTSSCSTAPSGDSRAPGCAPIPAGSSGGTGPRATGRWIKTWGAIAMSNSEASGVSVGKVKKREAEKAAMVECEATGARDCDIASTYKHQCAAAATASSGTQGTNFGSGETVDVAKKVATELCQSRGGQSCGVVYSACTEPKFEAFWIFFCSRTATIGALKGGGGAMDIS